MKRLKPIQLELPFTEEIEEINAELSLHREKILRDELTDSIEDLEQAVKYWYVE
jgi:hypothetical protein